MAETNSEMTFEAIVARLEQIAKQLETGDTPLEKALALFEEGVELAKRGSARLDAAERKLEVLRGDGSVEPLDANSPDDNQQR